MCHSIEMRVSRQEEADPADLNLKSLSFEGSFVKSDQTSWTGEHERIYCCFTASGLPLAGA